MDPFSMSPPVAVWTHYPCPHLSRCGPIIHVLSCQGVDPVSTSPAVSVCISLNLQPSFKSRPDKHQHNKCLLIHNASPLDAGKLCPRNANRAPTFPRATHLYRLLRHRQTVSAWRTHHIPQVIRARCGPHIPTRHTRAGDCDTDRVQARQAHCGNV